MVVVLGSYQEVSGEGAKETLPVLFALLQELADVEPQLGGSPRRLSFGAYFLAGSRSQR